jgi:cbb3-type cytochrome oxidase maturation protein
VEILYLLIPLSAVLVLAIMGVFGWALWRGQFEDLEHEGERILLDEPPPADCPPDAPSEASAANQPAMPAVPHSVALAPGVDAGAPQPPPTPALDADQAGDPRRREQSAQVQQPS